MFAPEFQLGSFLQLSQLLLSTDHGHLPSNRPSSRNYRSTIDLYDVVVTFQEAVSIVAGFNNHLERSYHPITKQLTDLGICDYWFSARLTTATHNTGGTNDAVIARCVNNDSQLTVSVVDVGLSDHLLTWPLPGRKKPPQRPKSYVAIRGASWTSLSQLQSRHHICASPPCGRTTLTMYGRYVRIGG